MSEARPTLEELVARVVGRLDERGVPFRVIGATALAAHGLSRSTQDVDLLTADTSVLAPELWEGVKPAHATLEVRRGDASDPLLGVVRIGEEIPDDAAWDFAPASVDLVLVRGEWAAKAVTGHGPEVRIGGLVLEAVALEDLVLLKLYAGGPMDAWDLAALLGSRPDRSDVVARVEARVGELPRRCSELWERIVAALPGSP